MDSKVIEKIQKLFALSNNNPSEEEAVAAALKAQKLMAKHNIAMSDIDSLLAPEEGIKITRYECGPGRAWKFSLASIIAQNFRCKTFSYGSRIIAFYGFETDAAVAKEVFEFLFKTGHRLADREVHRKFKERGKVTGVYNSFCMGYMAGIKEELGKQCKALMIVISPKVTEEFDAFTANANPRKARSLADNGILYDSYNSGKIEGHRLMKTKELARESCGGLSFPPHPY